MQALKFEDETLRREIEAVLQNYTPSQLDRIYLTACPKYRDREKEIPGIYGYIHDAATSRLLAEVQLRLDRAAVESEKRLRFGRVDGHVSVLLSEKPLLSIEVKVGRVKLVQPAVYSFLTGIKTVVADLQMGEVYTIDTRTARIILKSLLRHLQVRGALKMRNCTIPGKDCYYCGESCRFRKDVKFNSNPLKLLTRIFRNMNAVVDKVVREIEREMGDGGVKEKD
ncbi:hypothetical protein [Archaeoglobus sp.]|uniref:hypothetical protein n=1 Tax=Archaeoglobus sp. TaxID=1872626 RepID=UPI0024AC4FE0|nr:hypothetical protein [Archaeoglobus sp.]MDI3498229.1 hypothetical protein [Archaeoglobus sp.]